MNHFVVRLREIFSKSTDCRLCFRSFKPGHPLRHPCKNFSEICHGCSIAENGRIRYNNKHKRNRRKPTGKITVNSWLSLLRLHEWRCISCGVGGRHQLSLDHVEALGDGGTNTVDNVQPLCLKCHAKKDGHTKKAFSKLRRRYREFRMYVFHSWHINLPKLDKRVKRLSN